MNFLNRGGAILRLPPFVQIDQRVLEVRIVELDHQAVELRQHAGFHQLAGRGEDRPMHGAAQRLDGDERSEFKLNLDAVYPSLVKIEAVRFKPKREPQRPADV